jgi:hypothetical protein
MLRIYFLQVWFKLSDLGVEDALYDSAAMRGFVDINLGREPAPDENSGKDAHYCAPPPQNRRGPIGPSGYYLGCLTAKRHHFTRRLSSIACFNPTSNRNGLR